MPVKERVKELLPIVLMLLCAAVMGILMVSGKLTVDMLLDFARGNQPLLVAVILLLYVIKGFTAAIFHNVLILAAALAFPLWLAIAVNCVGLLLCVSASYLVGRLSKTTTLERELDKHPKASRYFRSCRKYGFTFCFTVHALGLPLELLGVLFGLSRIPYWKYVCGTFLAVAPTTFCITIAGGEWSLSSPAFWIILGIDLLMIAAGLWYSYRGLQKEKEQTPQRAGEEGKT